MAARSAHGRVRLPRFPDAGYARRRYRLNVEAIMTRQLVTVEMDDTLAHLQALFEMHGFHHLLVIDHRRVVGVISDRDMLRNLSPFIGKRVEREQDVDTLKRKAHQLMTRALISIGAEASIQEAARILIESKVSCLPVLDEQGEARGLVTWRDLLSALADEVRPEDSGKAREVG